MAATTKRTITEVLARTVDTNPDVEALIFPTVRLSYRELQARSRLMARSLIGMGVQRGDVVGLLMPNSAEFVTALFATAAVGALCVPINTRFRARELSHVIADSGMSVLITSDVVAEHVDFTQRLHETLPEFAHAPPGESCSSAVAPDLRHVVLLGTQRAGGMIDQSRFEDYSAEASEEQLDARAAGIDPDQHFLMLYTSGTTAMPKGCPLRHFQYSGIAEQVVEHFGVRSGDRLWDALPMFHASSLLPMLACFHQGATFISQVYFDPDETIRLLIEENVTLIWPAYTTIWQQVLTHPNFDPQQLTKVRGLLCVGPPETLELMETQLPNAAVLSCYGITECSGIPVIPHHSDPASVRYGTAGRTLPGFELEIRDPETRDPLPTGSRGLLWVRGEYVIDGYWKDPEKTAESFDENGWFCTGDLLSADANGFLNFHGRLKDMLKVGGENVASVEVEAFLSTHPAVKLAAVVGVPDPKYVEVPAAFIELRPGAQATEDELIAFCRQSLAGFKVPRFVRTVTEWPMSATKIRKSDLRETLLKELGIVEEST